MGLIAKTINRNKTGNVRKEDDRTKMIEDFFAGQKDVVRYEIADNKDWLVNVDGSIHLHEDDLDNGELFFKIGNLTGSLYCHCKHLKQTVIPAELDGEIVFVPNEEEQWKDRQASADTGEDEDDFWGMHVLTEAPTREEMSKSLESVLSDYVDFGFEDIDLNEIIDRLKNEKGIYDAYQLDMEVKPDKRGRGIVADFYVVGNGERTKLKLSAIEKTFYIMFILRKDGIIIEDIIPKLFLQEARKIYSQMGDRVQNDNGGIMYDNYFFSTKTLRTYLTGIRNALKTVMGNRRVIEKFAIEGYKAKEFKVQKATDEMRNLIHKEFGV